MDVVEPEQPGARRALRAHLGPATLLAPGGVPASTHLALGGSFSPGRRLAVEPLALIPVGVTEVSSQQGTADVRTFLFGIGGAAVFAPSKDWTVSSGAGAGVAWLHMSGDAHPPFRSTSVDPVAGVAYVRGSAIYRASSWAGIRADALVGAAVPRVEISFAGERVATWGRPFLGIGLGVEIP
jgi:hypothetical protein